MKRTLKKYLTIGIPIIALSGFAVSNANAITQSISATVTFLTPLSITTVVNANFGYVTAAVASTVYALDTANTVTVTSGPGASVGGTPASASMKILGSATQTIDISVGGYTTDHTVVPSLAVCKYGGASQVLCTDATMTGAAAPGAAGTTLGLGMTITAANVADGTVATPSFTVTVVYN